MDFSDDKRAADGFRRLLGEVFGDMGWEMDRNGLAKVKDVLPLIFLSYRNGLRHACSGASDWSQPANQWAYVYLYFAYHSYIVYRSMQHPALKALCREGTGKKLKVCSIGGGPGSDLAGLTKFLSNTYNGFARFDSLVLDKYPEWGITWTFISHRLPYFYSDATYSRCNLVQDRHLSAADRAFVRQADLLTLIRSFLAVSAFYRSKPQTGHLLRTILRDLKAGALVLYVDNQSDGDQQFKQEFALPAGLTLLAEFTGPVEMPIGIMPHNIQRYMNSVEYNPMRKCDLLVQLFKKPSPIAATVTPESAYRTFYTSSPLTTGPMIRTRRSVNTQTEVCNDNNWFGQSTNFQPYQPRQSASKPSKDRCECTIL